MGGLGVGGATYVQRAGLVFIQGHGLRLTPDCDGWHQETHQPIQFSWYSKDSPLPHPRSVQQLQLLCGLKPGRVMVPSAQVLNKAVDAQRLVLSRCDIWFLYLKDAKPRTRSV